MRISWLAAAPALLLLAAGLLAAPAGTARADGFPLSSNDNVVVDTVHDHIFASPESSAGAAGSAVLVTDLTGLQVAVVGGLPGVQGIVLSPDDRTLYAAVAGGNAEDNDVVAISTTTFKIIRKYPVPLDYSPQELAVEDGKVWVSYYTTVAGPTGIGDINVGAASPVFTPAVLPGFFDYAPKLVADPLGGGTLVAESTGTSPYDEVGAYDVATTPPTSYLAGRALDTGCGENSDIAVLPGGGEFVVAGCIDSFNEGADPDPGLQVFSTKTLQHVATWYGAYGTPTSVSVSATGLVAVGSAPDSNTGPDLYVFKEGAATPQSTYTLETEIPPGSSEYFNLQPGGLAFAPNGAVLTAVTNGLTDIGEGYLLYILGDIPRDPATLTLKASPSTANYRQPVTVTAHLGTIYQNDVVDVYAQPAGATSRTLIVGGPVGGIFGNGNLGVKYTPTVDTTFSVVFGGDPRYAPKTVTVHVGVRASTRQSDGGWYKSASSGGVLYREFHQTGTVNVTAAVAPSKHGECVAYQLERYQRGQWVPKTSACLRLNSSSEASWRLRLSGTAGDRFRVRVNYAGDKASLADDSSWFYYTVTR